ncbi:MAG: hypothetical protein HUU55_12105 [Myxococcales bacterium]|nr:hypothetical protein [Myxococcales bacterium]
MTRYKDTTIGLRSIEMLRTVPWVIFFLGTVACGDSDDNAGNNTVEDVGVVDTKQDTSLQDTATNDAANNNDTTHPEDSSQPDTVTDTIVSTDTAMDLVSEDTSDTIAVPDSGLTDTGTTDVAAPPDTDEELLNVPDTVGCEVELRIRLAGTVFLATQVGIPVPLTARLRNLTDTVKTVTVSDPCPNGVAMFSGLPQGYDYYQTCTAGACQGNLPPVVFTLQPKEELVIATTTINSPDDPCNQPLPKQTYDLLFSLPLTDAAQPNLCGPAIAAELTIE